jgi:hypothetical protein
VVRLTWRLGLNVFDDRIDQGYKKRISPFSFSNAPNSGRFIVFLQEFQKLDKAYSFCISGHWEAIPLKWGCQAGS